MRTREIVRRRQGAASHEQCHGCAAEDTYLLFDVSDQLFVREGHLRLRGRGFPVGIQQAGRPLLPATGYQRTCRYQDFPDHLPPSPGMTRGNKWLAFQPCGRCYDILHESGSSEAKKTSKAESILNPHSGPLLSALHFTALIWTAPKRMPGGL